MSAQLADAEGARAGPGGPEAVQELREVYEQRFRDITSMIRHIGPRPLNRFTLPPPPSLPLPQLRIDRTPCGMKGTAGSDPVSGPASDPVSGPASEPPPGPAVGPTRRARARGA